MSLKWRIEKISLPLNFTWKISRNSSEVKENFIIHVSEGEYSARGEVAFNVRYGESLESITKGFESFKLAMQSQDILSAQDLQKQMLDLKLDKSLRFGIESAWTHLQCEKKNISVSKYLGLEQREKSPTSFSLPILQKDEIAAFIDRWQLLRFPFLKVKVNENALELVQEVAKAYKGPLRVDANEAWQTAGEVLSFLEKAAGINIEFIEQPLPAHLHDELLKLKQSCPIPLVADESILDEGVSEYHAERFHAVNIKLMKSAGYIAAVEQLKKARELGLQTMLGCMVETSLGISSALHIAQDVDYIDLDGFLFLKDPFGLVKEQEGVLQLA